MEKSRLNLTFLPYRVIKNHPSTLEMDTLNVMNWRFQVRAKRVFKFFRNGILAGPKKAVPQYPA